MSTTITPVSETERFESLDVLRGIAVLGILMVNIQAFAMYWGALSYPPAHMSLEGANQTVWFLTHVFFELKFITIFSALFGAGVLFMVGEDPLASKSVHFRRMIWLFVIGLIHGFVFWFGDILVPYALAGMIVVFFRRMSPGKLIGWGLGGIALTGLLMVAGTWEQGAMPGGAEPMPYGPNPPEAFLDQWVAAYQASFAESRIYNAIGELFALFSQITFFAGRLVGVMFIGMALFKLGFLTAKWSLARYLAIGIVCAGLGIAASWWGGLHALRTGFAMSELWVHTGVNYGASLLTAFGYASLVMAACRIDWLKLVRLPFACAGRMAFTNYLTQTLAMTFIFVGAPGLGLFGTVERTGQLQIVLAVWAVQLVVSTLWLRVFRFGPFEWLWRSLSYARLQPFLRRKPA